MSSEAVREGIDLLHVLDALVKRAHGPSGLKGDLCVGVYTDFGEVWWRVRFFPEVETEFSESRPADVDAWVRLSDAQANSILDNGSLPGGRTPDVHGSRRLFERFVGRYLKKQSGRDMRGWGLS